MNFLHPRGKIRFSFRLAGLATVLLTASAAYSATYTWDGGGGDANPALNSAVNWSTDTTPPFLLANNDTYVFAGTAPAVPIAVQAGGPVMRNMTFNANTVFTFTAADPAIDKIVLGNNSTSSTASNNGALTNNSASTQTFNMQVGHYRGTINAAQGDIVFNGLLNVANGNNGSNNFVQTVGTHDVYIQGTGGGLVGMGTSTVVNANNGNLIVGDTAGVAAAGTVFISADSPTSSLNPNGGRWNGNIGIYTGNVRISTDHALGEGGTTGGFTNIRSAQNFGRLELTNNITVDEHIQISGRNTDNLSPQLVNINGNNLLTGWIEPTTGGNAQWRIQSDAGLLTLAGEFRMALTGNRHLHLQGEGNGIFEIPINHTSADTSANFLHLYKHGGGTWTLINSGNNYTGVTTIDGGTLALSGAGSIASSSAIDVRGGAFFNVSALSSTFTMSGTQTLMGSGTVTGSVQDAAGAKLAGGSLGTAGTLTIAGNLALSGGADLRFDLANVNTVGSGANDLLAVNGNLNLSGTTAVTINMLNGFLATGSYRLIDYTGALTGNQTNFSIPDLGTSTSRQTATISTAVANQVNLIVNGAPLSLIWKGGQNWNTWDLIQTANWNNNLEKFYNLDAVTFDDTGSNSPDVNLAGDVMPSAVTFNNSAQDYVLSGAGAIVGATGLTKNATGKVTLAYTGLNTFMGPIAINAGTLALDRADNVVVANAITGSGTLEKAGLGMLELTGANTNFSGPVTVTAGTLKLDSNNDLGTAVGLPAITNNAVLQLGGSANWTPNRTIAGLGNVEKVDANTVTLTADNTYLGGTTITGGTLQIGNRGATGSLGSGDITHNGTLLLFNRDASYTVANKITGTGEVRYGDAGVDNQLPNAVVALTGNSDYSGKTFIYHGIVVLKSDNALGDTIGVTEIRNSPTFGRTGALQLDGSAGGLTITENFITGGTGGGLMFYGGPGILSNIAGNNKIEGTITMGTGAGNTLIKSAAGNLELAGAISMSSTASGRSLMLGGASTGTVSGMIFDGGTSPNSLRKIDAGTWTLTNANYYTSYTSVHAGTLALGATGSIDFSNLIAVNSGATLSKTGGPLTLGYNAILTGTGTINAVVQSNSGAVITPSGPASAGGFSANFPGGTMNANGLTLVGLDTLMFELAGSAAGGGNDKINLNAGTLTMGSNNTNVRIVPNAPLDTGAAYVLIAGIGSWVNTGGAFAIENEQADGDCDTRYQFALTNTASQLLLNVSGTNKSLTWSGGGIAGDSTWNLKAAQNWNADADTFYQADAVSFNDTWTGTTDVTLAGTLLPVSIAVDAARDYVFSGTGKITGSTGIVKNGSGTLTISNYDDFGTPTNTADDIFNDFTGTVTINAGTLKVGNASALGSNSSMNSAEGGTVVNGGALDLNGQVIPKELVSIQNGGSIVNNGAADSVLLYVTLTGAGTFGGTRNWQINYLSSTDTSGTYAPLWMQSYLAGNGHALTKVDANYVTLVNLGETGIGDINITGGRLNIQGNTTLGNGSPSRVTLANSATLGLWDSTEIHSKPITVDATGGRIQSFSGTSTMTSEIVNNADNADVNRNLFVAASNDMTLIMNGSISGLGGVTKTGGGTVVFGGVNTYEGPTLISTGTLELAGTGQISPLSSITNDALFRVNGGTHELGAINGVGTMNVLAGSIVSAQSIVQETLTIGGNGTPAVAAVPEPSMWLLVLFGSASALYFRKRRYTTSRS